MSREDEELIGLFIRVPRERMMLICPDCGVVEGVDKERWATQSLFVNNPPVCTSCGTFLQPVDNSKQMDDPSSGR